MIKGTVSLQSLSTEGGIHFIYIDMGLNQYSFSNGYQYGISMLSLVIGKPQLIKLSFHFCRTIILFSNINCHMRMTITIKLEQIYVFMHMTLVITIIRSYTSVLQAMAHIQGEGGGANPLRAKKKKNFDIIDDV